MFLSVRAYKIRSKSPRNDKGAVARNKARLLNELFTLHPFHPQHGDEQFLLWLGEGNMLSNVVKKGGKVWVMFQNRVDRLSLFYQKRIST